MSNAPISIKIPDKHRQLIDEAVERSGMNRSAFFIQAVLNYIRNVDPHDPTVTPGQAWMDYAGKKRGGPTGPLQAPTTGVVDDQARQGLLLLRDAQRGLQDDLEAQREELAALRAELAELREKPSEIRQAADRLLGQVESAESFLARLS